LGGTNVSNRGPEKVVSRQFLKEGGGDRHQSPEKATFLKVIAKRGGQGDKDMSVKHDIEGSPGKKKCSRETDQECADYEKGTPKEEKKISSRIREEALGRETSGQGTELGCSSKKTRGRGGRFHPCKKAQKGRYRWGSTVGKTRGNIRGKGKNSVGESKKTKGKPTRKIKSTREEWSGAAHTGRQGLETPPRGKFANGERSPASWRSEECEKRARRGSGARRGGGGGRSWEKRGANLKRETQEPSPKKGGGEEGCPCPGDMNGGKSFRGFKRRDKFDSRKRYGLIVSEKKKKKDQRKGGVCYEGGRGVAAFAVGDRAEKRVDGKQQRKPLESQKMRRASKNKKEAKKRGRRKRVGLEWGKGKRLGRGERLEEGLLKEEKPGGNHRKNHGQNSSLSRKVKGKRLENIVW